ncbi:MAG: enoyl-ACP reductase [Halofilum sp. (in: g-proteobacteria)]
MAFLEGKRALITGVASKRSIAWGIAQAMRQQGAELAFTYQNEKLESRVRNLAAEVGSDFLIPLDASSDEQIESLASTLEKHWGSVDVVVHAMAFAPRDHLEGDYLEHLTREGFSQAHDVSSYSFAALGKALRPLMQDRNASMVTLSYLGAERAMPNYNVMGAAKASLEANVRYMAYALGPEGIRVNAVSAGPIRTLAASGIGDFRKLLEHAAQSAPLRRNVTIDDVGNTAAFLCSDLAAGITGEVIYVDAGFNTTAMTG